MNQSEDYLTLKYGTLKSWNLTSENGKNLLNKYHKLVSSASAMAQHDTDEQKQLICQMIDECGAETIYFDWDDKEVTKDEAKRYVLEF